MLTDTGVWCHPPVSLFPRTSFVTDTGLWLLVSSLIREGHPDTIVLWIFDVQRCLKRATVIEGPFYSGETFEKPKKIPRGSLEYFEQFSLLTLCSDLNGI
jgi:hypothetical protein